jgi:hypothetical protein
MTVALPTPGASDGTWGAELNDFLEVGHNADGTLKLDDVDQTPSALTSINITGAAQQISATKVAYLYISGFVAASGGSTGFTVKLGSTSSPTTVVVKNQAGSTGGNNEGFGNCIYIPKGWYFQVETLGDVMTFTAYYVTLD